MRERQRGRERDRCIDTETEYACSQEDMDRGLNVGRLKGLPGKNNMQLRIDGVMFNAFTLSSTTAPWNFCSYQTLSISIKPCQHRLQLNVSRVYQVGCSRRFSHEASYVDERCDVRISVVIGI